MKLVFATRNKNKIKEISRVVNDQISLISLDDINVSEDIPETSSTIKANASQKAWYVFNNYHYNCFADDTGLEVEALNGKPGVFSARYAGTQKNDENNIRKVLKELEGKTNRKARFITVISLIINGKEIQFEGIVNGTILTETVGSKGFGYDPIFKPDSSELSFAQMDMEQKNMISHRAIAFKKLLNYLNTQAF
jgi:XTP/dITP diphosphohydrolase